MTKNILEILYELNILEKKWFFTNKATCSTIYHKKLLFTSPRLKTICILGYGDYVVQSMVDKSLRLTNWLSFDCYCCIYMDNIELIYFFKQQLNKSPIYLMCHEIFLNVGQIYLQHQSSYISNVSK